MNIQKITSSIASKFQDIKGAKNAKSSNIITTIKNGKNKLTGALEALSQNAKTSIIKMNDGKKAKATQNYRLDALVAQGRESGLTKKEALSGAKALMGATGEFSYKNAQESASFLEKLPPSKFELRENLLEKYADKLKK